MQFESMAMQVGQRLQAGQRLLCTAESCTGGGLAHCITAIAGSSLWFERGFITYSNLAKQQMLGVSEALLRRHGAVSAACAQQMARGAVLQSAAQVGVATTGIAGPGGGSEDKPLGSVYIAWYMHGRASCEGFTFSGSREQVREQTIGSALQGLLALLTAA